ncbi:hypothetical protein D9756_004586 [Leucocoprinus leucothites]|uniref:F-box domain-containing protein n=1 Tax=Leucocoprinus leucothites TaxID=201217 RepID=A0A8H5LK18_9AGAR|nr:hypothetical protein D9756_004586 [Leucoagaricus leucothites]
MPTSIQDLPDELLVEIASHVPDKRDLSNASKAGSYPLKLAFQEQLFSSISFDCPERSFCKLFSLVHSPDPATRERLTGHIKTVNIRNSHNESLIYWNDSSPAQVIPREVAHTLFLLPGLKTLQFTYTTFDWDGLKPRQIRKILVLFSLKTLRNLTDLSLPNKRFPLCILPFCSNIKFLDMRDYLADTTVLPNEENHPHLPGRLNTLPLSSTCISLKSLHLAGLALISYFTTFASENRNICCRAVDLHYLDGLANGTPQGRAPSTIVGRFFQNVGGSIKELRLHITRFQCDNGTRISSEDLLSLVRLKSLELTLTVDMVTSQSNIVACLRDWLLPFLKTLIRLQKIKRLTITYEIHVMRYVTSPDLGLLSGVLVTLDKVIANRSLKEFNCYVVVTRADRVREHGTGCWKGGTLRDGNPTEPLSKYFYKSTQAGVKVNVAIFNFTSTKGSSTVE